MCRLRLESGSRAIAVASRRYLHHADPVADDASDTDAHHASYTHADNSADTNADDAPHANTNDASDTDTDGSSHANPNRTADAYTYSASDTNADSHVYADPHRLSCMDRRHDLSSRRCRDLQRIDLYRAFHAHGMCRLRLESAGHTFALGSGRNMRYTDAHADWHG